jgi:hypothetical protein
LKLTFSILTIVTAALASAAVEGRSIPYLDGIPLSVQTDEAGKTMLDMDGAYHGTVNSDLNVSWPSDHFAQICEKVRVDRDLIRFLVDQIPANANLLIYPLAQTSVGEVLKKNGIPVENVLNFPQSNKVLSVQVDLQPNSISLIGKDKSLVEKEYSEKLRSMLSGQASDVSGYQYLRFQDMGILLCDLVSGQAKIQVTTGAVIEALRKERISRIEPQKVGQIYELTTQPEASVYPNRNDRLVVLALRFAAAEESVLPKGHLFFQRREALGLLNSITDLMSGNKKEITTSQYGDIASSFDSILSAVTRPTFTLNYNFQNRFSAK